MGGRGSRWRRGEVCLSRKVTKAKKRYITLFLKAGYRVQGNNRPSVIQVFRIIQIQLKAMLQNHIQAWNLTRPLQNLFFLNHSEVVSYGPFFLLHNLRLLHHYITN